MCCAKNKKFLFPRRFPPPKAAAGLQQGALSSLVQVPTRAGDSQDMRPQVEYGVEVSGKLVLNPISAQKALNSIVFCPIKLNQRLKTIQDSCYSVTPETSSLVLQSTHWTNVSLV